MQLAFKTPFSWAEQAIENMDEFLLDHASCERKASSMAMSMVAHYPDKPHLVKAMIKLALEELNHFKQVMKIILKRNLVLPPDYKDPYVNQIRSCIRKPKDEYFLDRLLVAGVIEARGEERFRLISEALPEGSLKSFYQAITISEARHHEMFVDLAKRYFPSEVVNSRLETLIVEEAKIIQNCTLQVTVH